MAPNYSPSVKCLLRIASNQFSVDSLEDSHDVSLLIYILVEVGAIVRISTVDKPGPADGSCVALQVFKEKESLLIIVILEYEAWREEMKVWQVLLVVSDAADL